MNTTRPTLLVIDDEPEVLRSVHDLLRMEYNVITCGRGEDAIRVLHSPEEIHVVMSDQRMPGMSGVEVLTHAKQIRPDATRLLFTAYADIRAIVDAINEGNVFRYIAKPWEPEELETVVRQAVDQHNLITENVRLVAELRETNLRLVEANQLKGAFIEVASHELNTPVAVVLGMAELWKLVKQESASPNERVWMDRIQSAGRRLAATVERMLKLLKSDEFSHTLERQPTELEPLLRDVIEDLSPFLSARNQTVDLAIAPELGAADVDRAKFGDILMNLLVNAIKFTPDQGVIRVSARPEGEDLVHFEVADQGIGIEETDRKHLFEPFFTGFDTMHHSSGEFQYCKRGMGLGLCLDVRPWQRFHRSR